MKNVKRFCLLISALGLYQLSSGAPVGSMMPEMVSIQQQSTAITGTVVDTDGNPVIGANIIVVGTTNGTISDIDGNFTLKVPSNATLRVSFIGYLSQDIKLTANKRNYKIVLKSDTELLDEVVVVGYGAVKKTDVTGSVTSVKSEEMMKRNPTNLGQGLQGATAGVMVMRNSGDPEGGVSIRIRGVATVNGSSDPLFVVDGVQVGTNIDFLNPSDIESIEILKDASATAIYGSRGANGVILVTTKRGNKDKVTFNLTANYGIQNPSQKIDVANAAEFVNAVRISKQNDNASFTNQAWANPDFAHRLNSIDWQDEMSRTALQQNYNISASGGNEKTQSRLSIGYLDNQGIVVNSYFKRLTARANVEHTIKKRIKLGLDISYVNGQRTGGGNLYQYAKTIPTMDDVDENGNLMNVPVQYPDGTWGHFKQEGNGDANKSLDNPYAAAMTADNLTKFNRTLMSGTLNINILKGLDFRMIGSYNYYSGRYSNYSAYNNRTYLDKDRPDSFSMNTWEGTSVGLENYLTYDKDFGKHHLNLMAGYSVSSEESSSLSASSQDLVAPTIRWISLTKNTGTIVGDGGFNTSVKYLSTYGRINYSLMDRYLLTATVRRDGSSKFGSGNRYGVFPSLSLAWRLSEESFIKKIEAISNMKLRLGWGQTGNSGSQTDLSVPQVSPNRIMYYWYNNSNPVNAGGLAQQAEIDTNLKWETNEQTNVGLDLGFFNNKLNLTLDYFIRDSKDLLLYRNLRPSTGYNNIYTNAGHIKNTGFEFAVNYNTKIKDINLSATLNGSTLTNKAIEVGDDIFISDGVDDGFYWTNYSITRNGFPVGAYYGWKVDGIFQSAAEVEAMNTQAQTKTNGEIKHYQTPDTQAGDWKYKDLNGDGYISDEDRTIIGDGYADLNFGLNLSASYKNWDVSAYVYGVLGQDILSYSYANLTSVLSPAGGYQNGLKDYFANAWNEQNHSTIYPRLTRTDGNHNERVSDAFVMNGNFLKIGNIQIGYTMPAKWLKAISVDRLRLYASVENLATFTSYKFGNPEVGDANVLKTGFDGGRYPFPRTFSFGFNLSF